MIVAMSSFVFGVTMGWLGGSQEDVEPLEVFTDVVLEYEAELAVCEGQLYEKTHNLTLTEEAMDHLYTRMRETETDLEACRTVRAPVSTLGIDEAWYGKIADPVPSRTKTITYVPVPPPVAVPNPNPPPIYRRQKVEGRAVGWDDPRFRMKQSRAARERSRRRSASKAANGGRRERGGC